MKQENMSILSKRGIYFIETREGRNKFRGLFKERGDESPSCRYFGDTTCQRFPHDEKT